MQYLLLVFSWPSILYFNHNIQFDVAHSHSVVTSKVDLVDDCYVCDDVWPVNEDVVNLIGFGLFRVNVLLAFF